tara:strand:+ start:350 stop:1669 length:1320 start_codon:yes stop_codon:yes gene_type:complete
MSKAKYVGSFIDGVYQVAGGSAKSATRTQAPAVQVAAGGSRKPYVNRYAENQARARSDNYVHSPPPAFDPKYAKEKVGGTPSRVVTPDEQMTAGRKPGVIGGMGSNPIVPYQPQNLIEESMAVYSQHLRKTQAETVRKASASAKRSSRRKGVTDEQVDDFTAEVYGRFHDQDQMAAIEEKFQNRSLMDRILQRPTGSVESNYKGGRPVYDTKPNKEGGVDLLSGDVELHQRYLDAGTDSRARHGPLAHLTDVERDAAIRYEVDFLRGLANQPKAQPKAKSNGPINKVPSEKAGAGDVTPGDMGYAGFSGAFERHSAGAMLGIGATYMSEGEMSMSGTARGAMFGIAGGKAARMFTGSMRGGAVNSMARGVGDTLSAAGEGTMRKTAGDYISGAMRGFDGAKSQEAMRMATFAGAGLAGFSMGRDKNHSRGMNGSRGSRF